MKALPNTMGGIAAAFAIGLSASPISAETTAVSGLGSHTHIHGIAVDRTDPAFLFIATHHGLYRAGPDGKAERVSIVQDFMGFNAHPSEPGMQTWTEVSPGVDGPVDFHQMSVSPADPETIYGAYGQLQVSRDGGKSWSIAAPLPDRLIDLAGSTLRDYMLYAATETGLLASYDGGVSWQGLTEGAPVTMVDTAPDGTLYAFVIGKGLVSAKEAVFDFTTINGDWGDRFLLHFAVDPNDPNRLYGATGENEVLQSTDRGKTWSPFGQ